jgi:hypothetical protein
MATLKLLKAPEKSAVGTKYFNIVDDYSWTLTPKSSRIGVPYIELTEYEQDEAMLWANITRWLNLIKGTEEGINNPYQNLYHTEKTLTTFRFPYFEQYDHNINQNWEKTKGVQEYSLIEKLTNIATMREKAAKVAPGSTINQPQLWAGSGSVNYTINFHIFNTTGTSENIKNNQTFKYRLQRSTLHNQQSMIMSSPPAIFEVVVPGIRVCPAAVISQLVINNVGQMNLLSLNGRDQIIPDAWEFQITMTELVTESRQILQSTIDGTGIVPVKATTDTKTETKSSKTFI